LALLAENTVFVGLVMPGETVLLAGAVAASRGYLNIYLVFAVGTIAAILGNVGGYFIGYYGGRPLLEQISHRFKRWEKAIDKAESYFDSHGTKTVFFGRFAAGIRVFVGALAGASRMNFLEFLLYTVISVILWTLSISVLGYFSGKNWQLIVIILKRAGWFVLLIFAIVLLVYFFVRRRTKLASKIPNIRKDKRQ